LKKYCDGLSEMDKMKMPPKDFPRDFPGIDLLKHKHYIVTHTVRDEMVDSDHFIDFVAITFKAMHPFNVFLKRALED
jgi:uncharacterized protein (DUF2461 family)